MSFELSISSKLSAPSFEQLLAPSFEGFECSFQFILD